MKVYLPVILYVISDYNLSINQIPLFVISHNAVRQSLNIDIGLGEELRRILPINNILCQQARLVYVIIDYYIVKIYKLMREHKSFTFPFLLMQCIHIKVITVTVGKYYSVAERMFYVYTCRLTHVGITACEELTSHDTRIRR